MAHHEILVDESGFVNSLVCTPGAVEALDKHMAKAIQAIMTHGGAAKIKLSMSIKPIRGMDRALTVSVDSDVTVPKPEPISQAMFVNPKYDGLLSHEAKQENFGFERAPARVPAYVEQSD